MATGSGRGASEVEVAPDGALVGSPGRQRELRGRGRRTLRRLLDAGAEVFDERGLHAARVDDIVTRAETSHGTFYLYFANKEELFRSLATEVSEQMYELAESLGTVDAGPAGLAELRDWLGRFSDLYARYGAVIRAWTAAETVGSDFGRMGTDVLTRFALVIADRIGPHMPDDLDPQITALALIAMFDRLNFYATSESVRISRTKMLDTLSVATHAGLYGAITDPDA